MLLPPSIIRFGLLILLTIQNTVTILCIRHSRLQTHHQKDGLDQSNANDNSLNKSKLPDSDEPSAYLVSSLVFAMEAIKISVVLILLLVYQMRGSVKKTIELLYTDVICRPTETLLLSIPSLLYVIQDNLIVFALSCLDVGTYQVTYQGRVLTTAIFSWVLLNKRLSRRQWFALFLLMSGVILTQVDLNAGSFSIRSENAGANYFLGLLCVFLATVTSGFAGVYNEKLMKDGQQPLLLVRCFQLSLFCVTFALIGALFKDWNSVVKYGLFFRFTPFLVFTAAMQATGGILVAATIKFADNILKTFATSISIVLSCFLSSLFMEDLLLTSTFVLGTGIIISATYLYNSKASLPKHLTESGSISQSFDISVKEPLLYQDNIATMSS